MKTRTKKIKLMLALSVFFLLPLGLFAAPLAYICGTGSVTLKYTGTYTLLNGDRVIWQEVQADGITPLSGAAAVSNTSNGVAGDADLILTGGGNLGAAGEHYYRMHVVTSAPGGCTGDPSDAVSVYMLPAYAVALTPTTESYCEAGATNTTKSVITALATPAGGATLPAGVKFVYAWAGSTGGTPSGTDNNTYSMTATTVGSYTVASQATFDVSGAGGAPLKSAAGSGCTESATTTIKVSAVPTKPTITI